MKHHLHRRLDRLTRWLPPQGPPLPEVDPEWQDLARRDPKAHEMAVELFQYRGQHWADRNPTEVECRTDRTYLLLEFRMRAWEAGGVSHLFCRILRDRNAGHASATSLVGSRP